MSKVLILHHYEMSPFSEKVRAMFGYCNLEWQSVLTSAMPPRPLLLPLAGGYRRIPVAQIGADIFCDTRIISAEVATLTQRPKFAMPSLSADEQAYIEYLDSDIFSAAFSAISPLTLMSSLLRRMSPLKVFALIRDRLSMAKGGNLRRPSAKKALMIIRKHMQDLDQRVSNAQYLQGDSPTLADFSAFHSLWFYFAMTRTKPPSELSNFAAWYARIADFGHGKRQEISPESALDIAKKALPRAIPDSMREDENVGRRVQISPSDYGLVAVEGVLVGADSERLILAKTSEDLGEVNVHFPRHGYTLNVV
ncbi:glutathione S-transferase family protein [Zhongshania arctica]|uniref:Glutathione S-transferase family protein n=1 Tax=Zhongshania arctica TaxID=3238302 RepID=A0ABV3TVH8_9GAMM